MRKTYYGNDWQLGERYGYVSKEACYKRAKEAKAYGFEVRFGMDKSEFCCYYFEIVDPWEDGDT